MEAVTEVVRVGGQGGPHPPTGENMYRLSRTTSQQIFRLPLFLTIYGPGPGEISLFLRHPQHPRHVYDDIMICSACDVKMQYKHIHILETLTQVKISISSFAL